MRLYEKISMLQEEKQLKNTELARISNIPNSTLADILKGKTEKISLQAVVALAKALDCTVDYLAYDEVTDRYFGEEYSVNRIEYKHIEKYRTLDEHGKKIVDFVLSEEADRCSPSSDYAPYNETLEYIESLVVDGPAKSKAVSE